MNRGTLARLFYLLFGLASVVNGLWLLVDPLGWDAALRMQLEDFGSGTALELAMRKLGATYLCVSLAFFWCAVNPRIRSRVLPGLTLFFVLMAAVQAVTIIHADMPSHRWVTDAPFVFLPPLLLVLMLLPWPRLPLRGGETGRVKWFDSRKGFGFIVRDNGEELFVHFRAIQGRGQRSLKDGQRVRFRVGQGAKGPQAEDVEPLRD